VQRHVEKGACLQPVPMLLTLLPLALLLLPTMVRGALVPTRETLVLMQVYAPLAQSLRLRHSSLRVRFQGPPIRSKPAAEQGCSPLGDRE